MSKRMYEDLKEILCHELNEITRKGDIDREGLDDVYKLSSAITMIESLMKKGQQGGSEEEYSQDRGMSNRMNPMQWSYEGGGSNAYSRNQSYDGVSNERGVTDGRDNSRASNRMYSRENMSNDYSQRRGRDPQTGRYVSRDSYDSYDSYDDSYDGSYERGYSRHNAEQKVVQKLQDILSTTKDTHIRKAIMQAMEKIDG